VTCRQFTDVIADYLSGELPLRTRQIFESHFDKCATCRRYLAGYEQAAKLVKLAFDEEDGAVPDDVPPDLVKAILAALRYA
jgi:anti-sigma factor RsiW